LAAAPAAAAPRVMSLDQCADQYVLALSPREAIAGLSYRSDDADSFLKAQARGLPQRRATLEAALAARPQAVVRYWGGDPRLLAALKKRGVAIIEIAEANDLDGVRENVRQVAGALGQPARGEALIQAMRANEAAAKGAWRGAGALYMTPGGATAGAGTLVDAILRQAGLTNLEAGQGFRMLSLEALALHPPKALVLGFYDAAALARAAWNPGHHAVVRRHAHKAALAELPGAMLGCPAWFAADAAKLLADRAPR
jgi:iron complex transport system substrate-binding protein